MRRRSNSSASINYDFSGTIILSSCSRFRCRSILPNRCPPSPPPFPCARVGRESHNSPRAIRVKPTYNATDDCTATRRQTSRACARHARTLGVRPRQPLPGPPPLSPVVVLYYYTNMIFLVVGSILCVRAIQ